MTAADIAAEMAITVADLNEYVFGLIPTQVAGGGRTSPPARPGLQLIRS
ncbi:hypothetical protein SAMN06297387_12833 [Streptomyces zhaozhouensis]|uniref:Uncharacterized protein n=1 Tax=Streptomyces zhaozhouensis TaxID=1300267 RepID=A0A286E828_9ACTN|nr:hypothetical protein SAMN06297387_12833 [Streptomyces zhaozhouensis]